MNDTGPHCMVNEQAITPIAAATCRHRRSAGCQPGGGPVPPLARPPVRRQLHVTAAKKGGKKGGGQKKGPGSLMIPPKPVEPWLQVVAQRMFTCACALQAIAGCCAGRLLCTGHGCIAVADVRAAQGLLKHSTMSPDQQPATTHPPRSCVCARCRPA